MPSLRRASVLLAVLLPLASCATDPASTNDPDEPRFEVGSIDSVERAKSLSLEVLRTNRLGAMESVDNVQLAGVIIDHLGMAHTRVQQTVEGVPVFGGQAIVHLESDGALRSITDGFVRGVQIDPQPKIVEADAVQLAIEAEGEVDAGTTPEVDLQVLRHNGEAYLTFRVQLMQIERDEPRMPVVFVDAHLGRVVHSYNNLHTAKNRNSHDGNNGFTLPGTLVRQEGDAAIGDQAVDDAHDFAGGTYDCYSALFGRDSYDDNGASLESTAHHRTNYNNAFWNGSQMVYGDGDGSLFSPLSGSFDVVAHELTHAVTDASSNLIYQNESGALNEAMSDILAAVCDHYDQGSPAVIPGDVWQIGEDIFTPGTAGDALRYMDDPTADGSSYDYYPTRYTGTLDNGGVHWNSGIANLAFYLLVTGGTHPSGSTTVNVPAIGMDKAAQIFYRANNLYLTASSNFQAARDATADAATDLYTQTEIDAVHLAWDAVGVPGSGVCPWAPGDYAYCVDCGPCADGEGDCDSDAECATGLVCATDVGANYGWNADVDVCEAPASSCPWVPGDWDYCLDCGPCNNGEGDCDSNAECAAGTECVDNVGANYGWSSSVDVCETSCPWVPGDYDYCRDCGPCADGEGDCDGDAECATGLICAQDVGGNYGWNADVDVCEPPASTCPWVPGDWNYCRDCGPCVAGEGDCDGNSECATGTTCVDDVGANYGWNAIVDVCE